MKPVIILCAILCTGCSRYVQSSLDNLSLKAQTSLDRGQIKEAMSYSERGILLANAFGREDLKWKFRCLRAETLNVDRHPQAAVAALANATNGPKPGSQEAVRVGIDLAIAQLGMEQWDEAELHLNAAASLCQRPENAPWSAALNLRQGILAYNRKHQADAEAALRRAVAYAKQYDQPYVLANSYTYLGRILSDTGQYGRAVEWLVPAVDNSRQHGYKILLLTSLNNLGFSYWHLGDLDLALSTLKEAELLASELQRPYERQAALTVIGGIYEKRQDFAAQTAFAARALALARQSNNPASITDCIHNMANSSFNMHDFETSKRLNDEELKIIEANNDKDGEPYALYLRGHLEEQRKELEAAELDFQNAIKLTEPQKGETGKRLELHWEALISLANVHAAENQIAAADDDYRRAIEAFERARSRLSDDFKMTFRSSLGLFYNVYIRFLIEQGRKLDALRVAELSRAQVLSTRFGTDDTFVIDEPGLKAKAKSLNATILFYWLAPRASYLWVITPNHLEVINLPDRATIDKLADGYRFGILSSPKELGTSLYETLVRPAEAYIAPGGRVVIIPDGNLYQLNFETLLVPSQPGPHYWIEDVTISTANSLSLLRPSPARNKAGNILLIGDPVSPDPKFSKLPSTSVELHAISDRFPAARKAVYEGQYAMPSTYFKANPGGYSWIHFAAHGVPDQGSPMDSAIILSNDANTYKLLAKDIAKLPLHADLVTISACYSSGTRIFAGEGIVGLAWSFLRAGAHNVIASIWEANDYYTAKLMERLYDRLMAGDDPAKALHTAKLALLHSEYPDRYPRYWGAFQLYSGY